MKLTVACLMVCGVLSAQGPQKQDENAARMAAGAPPIYRVSVTARTAKAVSYQHRSGATKVDFQGTNLLPGSHGVAKVESKQGRIEIDVNFTGLQPASKNGAEYLTYVLWAITPEGRTANLGEVLLNGTKSKLDVSTELQVFGLIVTAEPYYAVTQPSDLIVMENMVRTDTVGKIETIDAKYELLQRGQYQRLANPLNLKADRKLPLELYEARNAVQIARAVGADRFAAETFQKAEKSLSEAEAYQKRNAGRKPVTMTSREAVQVAEDSRAIAVKRQEQDVVAAERQASADREASAQNARAAAQSETDRVTRDAEAAKIAARADAERMTRERDAQAATASAEADRLKRENDARMTASAAEADRLRLENENLATAAKAEADRLKVENDARMTANALENENRATAAKTEADRLKTENDARMTASAQDADRLKLENENRATAAKTEADRLKAENDSRMTASAQDADRLKLENENRDAAAKTEADRLKAENDSRMAATAADADRLKQQNDAQRAAAQAELDNAAKKTAQLEAQRVELRVLLLKQFNAILQTRDTARGLIVNMSDVLFDTAKFSLRPAAREKLAKVAGIVSGHPGLMLDVEGHTDSVGGDAYNQQLSEQRGTSVRDYLMQQGMQGSSVTSKGLGKTQPVASNETAKGRQENRRVEIVISGEVIGTEISKIVAVR